MTDPRWQLVAYVFVSIILRMVAAQLSRRRAEIAWVCRLSEGWVVSVLRFVYYIGLPYIALILGVVPGRYLGLVGLDRLEAGNSLPGSESGLLMQLRDYLSLVVLSWLPDLGTVAGLAVITLLFLGVVWAGYAYFRRTVITGLGMSPLSLKGASRFVAIQVVYQAVHWSSYRSAVWLLTDDLYLGVVGGVILVSLEWVLDPGWLERIRHPQRGEVLLVDASVLVATSVMFFFVPNLWLLLPVHGLLATVGRRLLALRKWQVVGSPSLAE